MPSSCTTARLHLALDRDGFAREEPVVLDRGLKKAQFSVEKRSGDAHTTRLAIHALPAGKYRVSVGGKAILTSDLSQPACVHARLPVEEGRDRRAEIENVGA